MGLPGPRPTDSWSAPARSSCWEGDRWSYQKAIAKIRYASRPPPTCTPWNRQPQQFRQHRQIHQHRTRCSEPFAKGSTPATILCVAKLSRPHPPWPCTSAPTHSKNLTPATTLAVGRASRRTATWPGTCASTQDGGLMSAKAVAQAVRRAPTWPCTCARSIQERGLMSAKTVEWV